MLALPCPECAQDFPSKDALRAHFKMTADKNHALTIDIKFSYGKKSGTIRFFRQADLSFKCPCGTKRFTSRKKITDHVELELTEEGRQEHTHKKFASSKPEWFRQ